MLGPWYLLGWTVSVVVPTVGTDAAATGAWRCWVEAEPERTEWMRWWMMDYCWSLAGMELGCDPEKRQKRKEFCQNLLYYLNEENTFNLLCCFLIGFVPFGHNFLQINFVTEKQSSLRALDLPDRSNPSREVVWCSYFVFPDCNFVENFNKLIFPKSTLWICWYLMHKFEIALKPLLEIIWVDHNKILKRGRKENVNIFYTN